MSASHDRLPPATEQALGILLVQDGLLSAAQLLAVQQYGWEHNLDLRQSLLKLKLIPEEKLQTFLVEKVPQLQTTAVGAPAPAEAATPSGESMSNVPAVAPAADNRPDLAQRERDIRTELKEIAETAASPDLVAQILNRAFETRATDIHFDPQETFLPDSLPDRRPAPRRPRARAGVRRPRWSAGSR